MNDGLRDVISIAAESAARSSASRRMAPVRSSKSNVPALTDDQAPKTHAFKALPSKALASKAPAPEDQAPRDLTSKNQAPRGLTAKDLAPCAVPQKDPAVPESPALGRSGLRLAFWLCGFHEALTDRQRQGERLTEREESLMTLSRNDFAEIRPAIIAMALNHLHAVVGNPALEAAATVASTAERFALDTVRSLAARGRQTLAEAGPEAAIALFGGTPATREPLTIFQLVFSTALGLVETFARMSPGESTLLGHLAGALEAEVGAI